jgi:HlyD family secretion protein
LVLAAAGVWWLLRPANVVVIHPTPTTITETIASSGRVGGAVETAVGVQAAGIVERLFVQEGDRVAAGQRLAILKNDVAEAQVALAEAALRTARAQLTLAARGALPSELAAARARVQQARAQLGQQRAALGQAEQAAAQARAQLQLLEEERDLAALQLWRSTELLQQELIARSEHDEARTRARVAEERVTAQRHAISVAEAFVESTRGAMAAAEANVLAQEAGLRTLEAGARPEDVAVARERIQEAEEALRVARRQALEAVVTAPFDGVVTRITAEVGQTVGTQGVLSLVSRALEIRVDVDEGNLADLALGQPAVISSSTFPEGTFRGTVSELAAAVDEARGTVRVTVVPESPPDWLRPGQTVNVNIVTNRAASRLVVPATAVRRVGDRSVVLIVRDGRALEQTVATRPATSAGVPIVGGIDTGALVIQDPRGIDAGDRVRVTRVLGR